jgi:transcriptional regulator with XRE-family HTH domain
MANKPTLKALRRQARLSVTQLSRLSGVATDTIKRAEAGEAVREMSALKILETLNARLGTSYEPEDLNIPIG